MKYKAYHNEAFKELTFIFENSKEFFELRGSYVEFSDNDHELSFVFENGRTVHIMKYAFEEKVTDHVAVCRRMWRSLIDCNLKEFYANTI